MTDYVIARAGGLCVFSPVRLYLCNLDMLCKMSASVFWFACVVYDTESRG